jgi:acyl-CoA thioester hydrolase
VAKPEVWQTVAANYPYSCAVETRFQDLDPLGHINNVAMAALFESGRVRFNRSLPNIWEERDSDERWLIARVDISYIAEAHFPGDIEICSGIIRVGNSSWDLQSAAFQAGICVAVSTVTLVLQRKSGENKIGDVLRSALETRMISPHL